MFGLRHMISVIASMAIAPITMVIETRDDRRAPQGVQYGGRSYNDGSGTPSGPCPGQFFARSPKQRAVRRSRSNRK